MQHAVWCATQATSASLLIFFLISLSCHFLCWGLSDFWLNQESLCSKQVVWLLIVLLHLGLWHCTYWAATTCLRRALDIQCLALRFMSGLLLARALHRKWSLLVSYKQTHAAFTFIQIQLLLLHFVLLFPLVVSPWSRASCDTHTHISWNQDQECPI